MLLKCTRENETTYHIPSMIQKISISPAYGKEDKFDVAFYVDNTLEIVRVFDTFEDAEQFVQKIYELVLNENEVKSNTIFDLNR